MIIDFEIERKKLTEELQKAQQSLARIEGAFILLNNLEAESKKKSDKK